LRVMLTSYRKEQTFTRLLVIRNFMVRGN